MSAPARPQLAVVRVGRTAWLGIKEPRVIRVIFLIGYLVTIGTGVATLTNPPRTIEGELGPILSVSWSLFWIVGGLVSASTVLNGWWQLERYGVVASMFGIGIYGVVIVMLHYTAGGSRLTQLGILSIGMLFFVLRLAWIRGHDFEPRG